MDVIGNEEFLLRTGDKKIAQFEATVCSSATANDGTIPFGRVVSTVAVKAYKQDNLSSEVTTDIIDGTPTELNNVVSITLKYPTTNGPGRYQLRFALTLDDGKIINLRANNIVAEA